MKNCEEVWVLKEIEEKGERDNRETQCQVILMPVADRCQLRMSDGKG